MPPIQWARQSLRYLRILLALTCFLPLSVVAQTALTIDQAVAMALDSDPQVAATVESARARQQQAIAESQWDDPMLKLGLANLPTDSFAFDEQPMTQKIVAISQKLPRGNSARLSGERGAAEAEAGFAGAADRELKLALDVSTAFLMLAEQLRTKSLLLENRRWLDELVGYNRARYASAQIESQQLLQSQLALARLDDRIAATDGEVRRARGTLSRWLADRAWGDIDTGTPEWSDTRDWLAVQQLPVALELIAAHPAIAASEALVDAQTRAVQLAQEAYKPQVGVELSYGQRDRTPMSDGADFASVMISVDMPLFQRNRQDRRLAASRARESAGILQRQNLLQQLHAGLNSAVAMAATFDERRQQYRGELLAQAEATADAVLKGYASNTADLDAVIAARMDAIEAQISALQLEYNYYRALAQVRYYRGTAGAVQSK